MAFKLVVSDLVNVPVKGSIPDATGKPQPFIFSLTCRRLKADALRDLASANDRPLADFITEVASDWAGVLDDDNQAVPFGPQPLQELLNIVGMAGVIFAAYVQACGAQGKEKN